MLTESDRRNIIASSLAVIVMILACLGTVAWYKGNVPEQVERSTINITRDDLRQAEAKWLARNVSEYELTLHSGQDDVTLRVNVPDGSIEVLQHLERGSPASGSQFSRESVVLRHTTVDELFTRVENSLDTVQAADLRDNNGEFGVFYDFEVGFDPTLGYPTRITGHRRVTQTLREVVWREKIQTPIEVKSLKIIK